MVDLSNERKEYLFLVGQGIYVVLANDALDIVSRQDATTLLKNAGVKKSELPMVLSAYCDAYVLNTGDEVGGIELRKEWGL